MPPTLLDHLAGVPGVESLTFYGAADGPLEDSETPRPLRLDADGTDGGGLDVAHLSVGPRFFETMGIGIVAGRGFSGEEHAAVALTAVVSVSLARHLFGRADAAVGQSVFMGQHREIVGVAADVTHRSLRDAEAWTIYTPWPVADRFSAIALRTRGNAAQLAPAIHATVREFSPRFEVSNVRTFGEIREASILRERALAHVSAVFGALAALLAAVGIAGVVAYTVAQRAPEIGLRIALGARVHQVVAAVVGRSMAAVAGGVAVGLLGVAATAPIIATQLFGVASFDPLAVGGAVLIVVASSALAAYAPASRAARRIDPIVVLKRD